MKRLFFLLISFWFTCSSQAQFTYTIQTLQSISCFGGSNGVLVAHALGGATPYQYNWFKLSSNGPLINLGITDSVASGLSSGNYDVRITDANGNIAVTAGGDYIFLPQPTAVVVNVASSAGCFGTNNGFATSSVSGGTSPYTYFWSNGATTQTVNNLAPGSYTLRVTDFHQCITISDTFVIAPVSAIVVQNVIVQPSGGCNGSISLTVSGGTAPYVFSWSSGAVTQNLINLCGGFYTVTITDAAGCVVQRTYNLSLVYNVSVSLLQSISCNDGLNGKLVAHAVAGTAPYLYQWYNAATGLAIGQTDSIAIGLASGSYYVTTVDAGGNSASSPVKVITAPSAIVLQLSSNNGCFGTASASATVTASGGTGSYTYLWSNGATTATISNVSAATFSVTVKDANQCPVTGNVAITPPTALTVQITSTASSSCQNNGTATASPAGGTGPYSYFWSTGATTASITNLAAGTYSVTETDAHNCSITNSVTITQQAPITLHINVTNALCFNGTGSASAIVSGGIAPYSYTWSNGSSTSTANNLAAGTHYLIVSDANNCGLPPQTFTVTRPASPVTATISGSNVTCFGAATGSASVTPSGGTGPYTFLWSNSATTNTINNIPAGSYNVTVKDANQCATAVSITITQSPILNLQLTGTNSSCGGNTGSASVSVTGGVAPYIYLWSNGAMAPAITGLAAGSYSVTVTDANQCSKSGNFTITQPVTLTLSLTKTNVNCFGNATGMAASNVSGGVAPYSYLWSNGTTTSALGFVIAGTYNITVTDANQCSITGSIIITQPPQLAVSVSSTNVSCFGAGNGTANAQASGGILPYTYSWNNGSTTQTLTGLLPNQNLYVRVTDNNGCQSFSTPGIEITQPAPLTAVISSTPASCFGGMNGAATVTPSGGTAPYTYIWSTGATTSSITNAAGTYTVSITDAHQCNIVRNITIAQPSAAVSFTSSATMVNCFGGSNGSATIDAAGGTAPYSYLWSNTASTNIITNLAASTYTFTIRDINNCIVTGSIIITQPAPLSIQMLHTNVSCFGGTNGSATAIPSGGVGPYNYVWSTGAVTSTITGLVPGAYNVTVKDANQCTSTQSVTITQAQPLTLQMASTNLGCFGGTTGTASVTVAGGISPYQYLWSNGSTANSISNLSASTYSVTVKDANNCTISNSVVLTQPTQLTVLITKTNATCFGFPNGTATATPTGGTGPYLFNWSNGTLTATNTNLAAGTYSVTVTDANQCAEIGSIIITAPLAVTGQISTSVNVSCFGGNNGSATVAASGGTAPYSYAWSNGAVTATATGLNAAIHSVDITDANGCTGSASVIITQPAQINIQANSVMVNCFGQSTGSISLTVSGGIAPYQYAWTNGATGSNINNLPAGSYTVTVTDANGCLKQSTVVIWQPSAALTAQIISTNITPCFQFNNGTATAQASGGTTPYQYSWSNGATTDTISNLAAGTYTATITDAKGCIAVTNVTITQPLIVLGNLGADRTLCVGQNVVLNATGNYSGSSYLWTSTNGFTSTTPTVTLTLPGTYYVRVINSAGCIGRDTIMISNAPNTINAEFIVASQVFKGIPIVLVNITSTATDSITWLIPNDPRIRIDSFSQVRAHLIFRDTGTYLISMRSRVGQCEKTVTKQIIVLPRDSASLNNPLPSVFDPLIRDLTVSPNPTPNGQFTVRVLLKDIMPVRLRIIEITYGRTISDIRRSGLKLYQENYLLNNMNAGVYIVLLESGTENRIFKFIKN